MILLAGLHLVSWRCFFVSFCFCFCYDIYCCSHLRHINRRHVWAATYSMLLALRPRGATPVSPPPQPMEFSPSVTGYVRWASGQGAPCLPVWSRGGDPGLRFVRRRGCRASRRAKRKQTLSADRKCQQLSSPAPSDRVSSSAVLGCLSVRSLLRKYDDVCKLCRDRRIDLLCLTETWHDADSAVLGRLRRKLTHVEPG